MRHNESGCPKSGCTPTYKAGGKGINMGKLIQNELLKLKYSGSLKIVWGYFLFIVVFTGLLPLEASGSYLHIAIMRVGYGASFALPMSGSMMFGVFAVMTAGMITREFSQGTIHNALSCGVSRKRYFAAKVASLFGMALVTYLISVILVVVLRSAVFGFNPRSFAYPNYLQVNLVYHISMMALILIFMSIFILLAYLFKRPALTFLAGFLAIDLESLFNLDRTAVGGPLQAMKVIFNSLAERYNILQIGVIRYLLPGIIIGILSLVLAYLIFMKKDVN